MILLIRYYTAPSDQSVVFSTHVSDTYHTLVARGGLSRQFVCHQRSGYPAPSSLGQ